jgi:hypothetical protein
VERSLSGVERSLSGVERYLSGVERSLSGARDSFARTALILIITFSLGQDSPDIDMQVINIITAVRARGAFAPVHCLRSKKQRNGSMVLFGCEHFCYLSACGHTMQKIPGPIRTPKSSCIRRS